MLFSLGLGFKPQTSHCCRQYKTNVGQCILIHGMGIIVWFRFFIVLPKNCRVSLLGLMQLCEEQENKRQFKRKWWTKFVVCWKFSIQLISFPLISQVSFIWLLFMSSHASNSRCAQLLWNFERMFCCYFVFCVCSFL